MTFTTLGLTEDALAGVEAMGWDTPTPIQEQAIPFVLDGRDVVGCAQTGTGKTAAFLLPVLSRIPHGHGTRALVITPTRELALQIESVAQGIAHHTHHGVLAVYGGVGYAHQQKGGRKGTDLIVATPGRLLDLLNRGDIDLSHVEVLVVDEADRMLDMGFWPDVKRILRALPEQRQTLLFSATMSPEVTRVVTNNLTDPARVEVSRAGTTAEAIDQRLMPVSSMQKTDLLAALIHQQGWNKVLVFTKTKMRCDRIAAMLKTRDINAVAIHGDLNQTNRVKALDGFKTGEVPVLVATDIVARGIDVDEISHVINYDLPENPEDYVHRVGRTARAGKRGSAVSFMGPEEEALLRPIERLIDMTLPIFDLEGFDYRDRIVPREDRNAKSARNMAYGGKVMGRRRRGPGMRRR